MRVVYGIVLVVVYVFVYFSLVGVEFNDEVICDCGRDWEILCRLMRRI